MTLSVLSVAIVLVSHAAKTKYRRLGGLNRNFLLTVLEFGKSKIKRLTKQVLSWGFFNLCLLVAVISLCAHMTSLCTRGEREQTLWCLSFKGANPSRPGTFPHDPIFTLITSQRFHSAHDSPNWLGGYFLLPTSWNIGIFLLRNQLPCCEKLKPHRKVMHGCSGFSPSGANLWQSQMLTRWINHLHIQPSGALQCPWSNCHLIVTSWEISKNFPVEPSLPIEPLQTRL